MKELNATSWTRIPKWEELPDFMQTETVFPYYKVLSGKSWQLRSKRLLDIVLALNLLLILAIPMLVIAILIKRGSTGPVFYRQERVTTYGIKFRIHKFRTMVSNADQVGSAVTVNNDSRVTAIGSALRKYRLDELPQLLDVIEGTMSFVGTRPEVTKYVNGYQPEMYATLLLPAGITSETALQYKDEAALLDKADDVDAVYIEQIVPEKMKWNLKSIREFSLKNECKTMIKTVLVVMGKDG